MIYYFQSSNKVGRVNMNFDQLDGKPISKKLKDQNHKNQTFRELYPIFITL